MNFLYWLLAGPYFNEHILYFLWKPGQNKNICFLSVLVHAQSRLTLWGSMDCSPPGSSVHGISQASILEWVAISFSRGSSQPRNWTHIYCIGRQILWCWATGRAHLIEYVCLLSCVQFFATPWIVVYQTSLSIETWLNSYL